MERHIFVLVNLAALACAITGIIGMIYGVLYSKEVLVQLAPVAIVIGFVGLFVLNGMLKVRESMSEDLNG